MPFEGGLWHGLLARPEARHDTKYFGPCQHDTNMRVVRAQNVNTTGYITRPVFWTVLRLEDTKIARRHFYNYRI